MEANFLELDSIEKLDQAFDASHSRPVIILKHSITCGISASVFRDIRGVVADVHLVIVQRHRQISDEISFRTGIRHESPQAIVLVDGRPVYHASHYDINAPDIESGLGGSMQKAAAA